MAARQQGWRHQQAELGLKETLELVLAGEGGELGTGTSSLSHSVMPMAPPRGDSREASGSGGRAPPSPRRPLETRGRSVGRGLCAVGLQGRLVGREGREARKGGSSQGQRVGAVILS